MTEQIKKFISTQSKRVDGFNKIGMPEKGEQIMLVSDESFNALTFLLYIAKSGNQIEELVLSFYSFNMKAMEFIEELISKGFINKFYFQTSFLRKYGSSSKIPKKLSNMMVKFGIDRIQGSFIRSHSKIFLCKTKNNFYVVEGSGNIATKNTGTEQYLIEDCEESYNFHKNWITTNFRRECIK